GAGLMSPSFMPAGAEVSAFTRDPLDWLLRASRRGRHTILSHSGPILSRSPSARGTVAVFGPEAVRDVLGDIETFGMPMSISVRHRLPQPLANLNNSIFSMTGTHHRQRQRMLAKLLGPGRSVEHRMAIDRG